MDYLAIVTFPVLPPEEAFSVELRANDITSIRFFPGHPELNQIPTALSTRLFPPGQRIQYVAIRLCHLYSFARE